MSIYIEKKEAWKKMRLRRNRKNFGLRELVAETHLTPAHLVYPCFLCENSAPRAIGSLPGVRRYYLDELRMVASQLMKYQIHGIALFPLVSPEKKDLYGSAALEEGLVCKAICLLKKEFPELVVIADVALDPYTSHGHDGILDVSGDVDNDRTIEVLKKMSLLYASCGIDMVAPSDMMDGRVGEIRDCLEESGYSQVGIISYCVKYASSLYRPFREAVDSPFKGSKKTYQMDYRNKREALLEALLDQAEGADILMVKPAGWYLDVISEIKKGTLRPIAGYQVSGEYAMIQAAAKEGWTKCAGVK